MPTSDNQITRFTVCWEKLTQRLILISDFNSIVKFSKKLELKHIKKINRVEQHSIFPTATYHFWYRFVNKTIVTTLFRGLNRSLTINLIIIWIFQFFKSKLYCAFLWIGFNCLKVAEPPRGNSLIFNWDLRF